MEYVFKICGYHLSAACAFVVVGEARSVVGDVEIDPGEDSASLFVAEFETRLAFFVEMAPIPTSDLHIRTKLGKTREEVLEMTAAAVAHAKDHGLVAEISTEDGSRADRKYLKVRESVGILSRVVYKKILSASLCSI